MANSPAYIIGNYSVANEASLMEYVQKVVPIMNQYGGKLIALDRNVTRLEGQPEQLLTIVEYPNMESAKAFYSSK